MSRILRVGSDPSKNIQAYQMELIRKMEHALKHIDASQLLLGLTASLLVSTNSSGKLSSVANLQAWIEGVVNQISVTDDGDGTITISLPQDIHKDADVEFDSIKLDDLTATRMISCDVNKKLVVIATLSSWIAGTSNQVTITDDGDGTITISLPQNIDTGANPTFNNITGTGFVKGATGQFGDVANGHYSEFEADGTYKANGDATTFDDLLGDVTRLQVIGTGIAFDNTENAINFKTTANLSDYVISNYQNRHKWKLGSSVYPHIHFEQDQNNIPNFFIRYRWQRQGQAKTTAWTDYKCNTTAFTYVSGTLNQIVHGLGITPPVGYSLSDIIQFRIFRDNANTGTVFAGADPYTTDVLVTGIDIHIEADTLASRAQYSK